MHRWLTHYAVSTQWDNGAEHIICIIYRGQMDKLLQWPSLQSICNVEEALSPALMLASADKNKSQKIKRLFTALSFILKCYHYNHACRVIHVPVLFPQSLYQQAENKMYWLDLPFSTRKRTDICSTYLFLGREFCMCKSPYIAGGTYCWETQARKETAAKLGDIYFKLWMKKSSKIQLKPGQPSDFFLTLNICAKF